MALWTGLGQAATVAQLVGADAGGLISMIIKAAVTARQNKKECEQLASRVFMIGELLPHLQDSEVMRLPLAELGNTLREAHELVTSCQGRSAMYQFVTAGRQADRFRDVQRSIDFYLLAFNIISHIDITRRLDRIDNILLPNDTSVPPAGSQSQLEAAEAAQDGVDSIKLTSALRKKAGPAQLVQVGDAKEEEKKPDAAVVEYPYPWHHYYQYAQQLVQVGDAKEEKKKPDAAVVEYPYPWHHYYQYAPQPAPVVYQHHTGAYCQDCC